MVHLQAALDLTGADDSMRGGLLLALGEAALQAAAENVAAAAYQQAEVWFARAGDPVATARAAHGRGMVHWRLDNPGAAEEALRRALCLLDAAGCAGPEAVRVRVDLASLLGVVLGRHDEAEAIGRPALELVHPLDDARLEAAAACTVGFMLVRGNDLPAGVPLLEHALELAITHDDPAGAAEVCACLAQAYCWSGQIERSLQVGRQREAFARRFQQPYQLCYVSTWLAFVHGARGEWAEAERWLAQAGPAAECVASAEPAAFLRQVRGYLAFQRADYRLAEREFRAAVTTFRHHDPGELVLCLGPLGLALLAMDRRREAEQVLAEQERVLAEYAVGRLSALSAEGCLGLMAVQMGDRPRAGRIYPPLLACQGQHHWFLADRVLGQLALLAGDWPAAEGHLSAAESMARRENLRPELARVLAAQSELALARGGAGSAARARELLGGAAALYRELGLPGQVRAVRRKLRDLPTQPAGVGRPCLPAGLSRREAQVLRLVAAGMSNRQIAQELALSESTVAKHLTSIFNKTASENRAAAAAFAIRHDLA